MDWRPIRHATFVALIGQSCLSGLGGEFFLGEPLQQIPLRVGHLSVVFRDNAESPKLLSGVDSLWHVIEAPNFDAFDPHDPGSSAGLNFEHIISGHADPANWFAPRLGVYRLYRGTQTNSVVLTRRAADDPWTLESTMTYAVTAPHAIDFEFRCRALDARRFGRRQYVIHRVETAKQYGYRGRLVWKKFVSPEDCLEEYESWRRTLPVERARPAVSEASAPRGSATRSQTIQDQPPSPTWRLPPTHAVTRTASRLVNYFHLDLPQDRADHRTERLAQWDVVILNHDLVTGGSFSLARLRQLHPRIKILAWIPLQGPNGGLAKGVPPKGKRDWYARQADGTYLVPHWGGHLMNVCTQDRAWLKHVLNYVRRTCLRPGGYDGLMLDCLWPGEPAGHDANGDGVCDARDTAAWREAMVFLLRRLRAEFPEAILVGNGGVPWPPDCPYYEYANGCMHENALGDQFGGVEWRSLWDACRTSVSRVSGRSPFHFIQVDVRADGRSANDAASLTMLTANDRRRLRLGWGTTLLLDGGYFGFDRGDCLHGQLWWFDDYEVDPGAPLEACREGQYAAGTFSREFERGLVIVNPTEAAVFVSHPTALTDLLTGTRSTTISVPAKDARFLLWPGVRMR